MDSFYLCLIDKHHICVVTNEVIDANLDSVRGIFCFHPCFCVLKDFSFEMLMFSIRKKMWLVIVKVCFELVNGVEIHNYI